MIPKLPAIVGAVADFDTLNALPQLAEVVCVCDFIEFRVDALRDHQDLLNQRLTESSSRNLITVRDPAEGGIGNLSPNERCQLMESYLAQASILDVEVRNLKDFASTVSATRDQETAVLASYHDFKETPPKDTLHRAIQTGRETGADGVKLAVTTHSSENIHTLLSLFEEERDEGPLAIMGMGPLGMSSRVLFAEAGSRLTYTYLKNANAPGQWHAPLMRTLFTAMGLTPTANSS